MTIARRTIIITGKMLGADTDAEHHVSVSKAPWEHSASVSLAGPRPEVEPRRKGIMQHPDRATRGEESGDEVAA